MFLKSAILICLVSIGAYYIKYHNFNVILETTPVEEQRTGEFEDIDAEKPVLFTKEEVARFVTEEKLYLCILGHVFDVTKGKSYYKKGETYHCFIGRDGTRAFVSGNFTEEGLIEDIDDISGSEILELKNWLDFYGTNYIFKGYLIGRFFDSRGTPTKHWHEYETKVKEAEDDSEEVLQEKLKYPPCNIEWSQDAGTRVWCSTKSGGIERDWTGVPRKLYTPGADSYRCACVQHETTSSDVIGNRHGNLEEYEECDARASSCYVRSEED